MIATQHAEVALHLGITAFLDILDPGAIDRKRHFIFRLASSRASMTTYAFALIDNPAEIHASDSVCMDLYRLKTTLIRFADRKRIDSLSIVPNRREIHKSGDVIPSSHKPPVYTKAK